MRRRVATVVALVVTFSAGILAGAVATPAASSESGQPDKVTVHLGPCAHEDGNPDGKPCFWTDPDDGRRFVVDSSEYYDNLLEAGKQLPTLAS